MTGDIPDGGSEDRPDGEDAPYQIKMAELRRELDIGIDQANRGLTVSLNEETIARIKARGRERLAARRGPDQP